jgi:hypothetical protein
LPCNQSALQYCLSSEVWDCLWRFRVLLLGAAGALYRAMAALFHIVSIPCSPISSYLCCSLTYWQGVSKLNFVEAILSVSMNSLY